MMAMTTIMIIPIMMVVAAPEKKESEKNGCLIPNAMIMTEEIIMILAEMNVNGPVIVNSFIENARANSPGHFIFSWILLLSKGYYIIRRLLRQDK